MNFIDILKGINFIEIDINLLMIKNFDSLIDLIIILLSFIKCIHHSAANDIITY